MLEFKEMIYDCKRTRELLGYGEYKGYKYYIISLGTHPVAYVEIPKNHELFGVHYNKIYNIDGAHGGLTYSDSYLKLPNEEIKGWFIGWDYAHAFDYVCLYPNRDQYDAEKWTTEEIYEEVKDVINQIVERKYKYDKQNLFSKIVKFISNWK